MDKINKTGQIGSPYLFPHVILKEGEHMLPVKTLADGLANDILIMFIIFHPVPYILRRTRDKTTLGNQ